MAAELHERAKTHAAKQHYTDFSGLVTKRLVAELTHQRAFPDRGLFDRDQRRDKTPGGKQ
jgi:hypothetical protein